MGSWRVHGPARPCSSSATATPGRRSAAGDCAEPRSPRLGGGPAEVAMRLHSGELVARIGASVDELSGVLVRAVLPIAVAAVLSVAAVATIAVISPASAVVLAVCLVIAG